MQTSCRLRRLDRHRTAARSSEPPTTDRSDKLPAPEETCAGPDTGRPMLRALSTGSDRQECRRFLLHPSTGFFFRDFAVPIARRPRAEAVPTRRAFQTGGPPAARRGRRGRRALGIGSIPRLPEGEKVSGNTWPGREGPRRRPASSLARRRPHDAPLRRSPPAAFTAARQHHKGPAFRRAAPLASHPPSVGRNRPIRSTAGRMLASRKRPFRPGNAVRTASIVASGLSPEAVVAVAINHASWRAGASRSGRRQPQAGRQEDPLREPGPFAPERRRSCRRGRRRNRVRRR